MHRLQKDFLQTFYLTVYKSIKQKIDHWQVLSVVILSPPVYITSRYCPYFGGKGLFHLKASPQMILNHYA